MNDDMKVPELTSCTVVNKIWSNRLLKSYADIQRRVSKFLKKWENTLKISNTQVYIFAHSNKSKWGTWMPIWSAYLNGKSQFTLISHTPWQIQFSWKHSTSYWAFSFIQLAFGEKAESSKGWNLGGNFCLFTCSSIFIDQWKRES